MKKNIKFIITGIVLFIVLIISFIHMKDSVEIKVSKILDVTKDVEIDGKYLKVTYTSGNMIDTNISFNNTLEKNITIVNHNETIMSYALEIYDATISNDELYYSLEATNELSGKYKTVVDNKIVKGNQTLGYNLAIDPNSTIYLKLTFNAHHQGNATELKGILNIKTNLTEKDIFIREVNNVDSAIKTKLDELNGISTGGNYIASVEELVSDSNIKGYVLINAEDISSIEYYYYVYSNKFMLKDFNFTGNISKNAILDLDTNETNGFNPDNICRMKGKKNCANFSDLTYNTSGGKKEFADNSKKVIELVNANFKGSDKKVYIYDVTTDIENPTNIRGFILIDNTKDNSEYYIYLTNNMFMISGYNMTKYGEFSHDSTTIRAYTESAFNLSSQNAKKVCSFSGFSDCVNKEGSTI